MPRIITQCVGMQFRPPVGRMPMKDFVRGINYKKMRLQREASNRYDPNAIMVMIDCNGQELHIGYIPKDYAAALAPLMDKGNAMAAAMVNSPFVEIEWNEDDFDATSDAVGAAEDPIDLEVPRD